MDGTMNILLNGYAGQMGRAVCQLCGSGSVSISAGVDPNLSDAAFPTYKSFEECTVDENVDAIIDFSNHASTPSLLSFAEKHGLPTVIATTGHTEEERLLIQELSAKVPVFFSSNYSFGVAVLLKVCKEVAALIGGEADIEIIEKHHNRKVDAPSGTALSIARGMQQQIDHSTELVFDRSSRHTRRSQNEIGISSVRAGNIVGEHEVLFCWGDEMLSLKHNANNRIVFAEGAIRAARFLMNKKHGLYTMDDMISEYLSRME